MYVRRENSRTDKNFPLFALRWAIVISAVISVEQRWCNAVNETSYSFSYNINDDGIVSQHTERQELGITKGSYSFLQPDGQIRVVEYQVDTKSGFKATVKYRKRSGTVMGHLRYPKDFYHPLVLAVPVSFITPDLFDVRKSYIPFHY